MSRAAALAQQGTDTLEVAKTFKKIDTPDQYAVAVAHLKGIRSLTNEINEWCDPNIRNWHAGHKQALAQKKDLLAPLKLAENAIKGGVSAYKTRLQKAAQEARRRAEEEARAAAEKEREAEAQAHREAGDDDIAEIVEEMPVKVQVVTTPEPEVDDDVTMAEHVVVEVLDKQKAVAFVLENWAFMNQLVDINMKELRKLGIAQRENFAIPGCKCTIEMRTRIKS